MDTRDMWEDQVSQIAKQTLNIIKNVEKIEQRLTYLEGVVITLLVALKEGGVIVDSTEDPNTNTYDLTEN